jgi:hypothetical protein
MKRKYKKWDRERIGHYHWIATYYGDEAAAMFFPEVHRRLHPEDRPPTSQDSGKGAAPETEGNDDGQ